MVAGRSRQAVAPDHHGEGEAAGTKCPRRPTLVALLVDGLLGLVAVVLEPDLHLGN